eukprot:a179236_132.p2 GENE.a179236_132~~a179236_132.p2  ORF type:complete len:488 (+),score=179.79 a179236_132:27-1466(+)
MAAYAQKLPFTNRLVMIGFGSLGQGLLPLFFRHFEGLTPEQITIITTNEIGAAEADEFKVKRIIVALTEANYRSVLEPLVSEGDFIVNVSVEVASTALVLLAGERGAFYIDTCIEPWPGGYTSTTLTPEQRTNSAQRDEALALRSVRPGGRTAILAHGANPGLISHLFKRALLILHKDIHGSAPETPTTQAAWAKLAADLHVVTAHVAERDTQVPRVPKRYDEFVNTWSVDGFVSESFQPSELGWGTAETAFPADGHKHTTGCDAAIYLDAPSAAVHVKSWTPQQGPYVGHLVTHNEAISLADYMTLRDAAGAVVFRPTVHYAYHPCDAAVISLLEMRGRSNVQQTHKRVLQEHEILCGVDELGILLAGHARNAMWHGSLLSIEETRALVPYQNATGLQVTSAVIGAMMWALENPDRGIVEAEDMDHERVLAIADQYLGRIVTQYTDWTPLTGRGPEALFPEHHLDLAHPWSFTNVRLP